MAVMTDVREAAQGLIEYAIHRSMIGQDDRIWAYNTILECIGATGPALDMAWALQVEKLSLVHPDTLPDFDLEGTLAALSEAAVANGAARTRRRAATHRHAHHGRTHAEAFGCKRGVQRPHGRQRAPRRDDWFYGLCCDAGYVRRAAIARNIKWSTPPTGATSRLPSTCQSPKRTRAILPRPAPPKTRREVSRLPALHRKRRLSRTLRCSRRRRPSRPPESARYPH